MMLLSKTFVGGQTVNVYESSHGDLALLLRRTAGFVCKVEDTHGEVTGLAFAFEDDKWTATVYVRQASV